LPGSLFGLTPWLLSGILSLPWSRLSSLPPDVDVPLPLGLGCIELPVVGEVPGVAELAAGSPVVDPRPLGAPCASSIPDSSALCPKVIVLENAKAASATTVIGFIAHSPW
jgi:hypothetical protein